MTRVGWRALGGAAVVLLLLGDTAAWWLAQRGLALGVAEWSRAMAAEGVSVGVSDAASGSWPFAASRVLDGLTLRSGDSQVSAEYVVLRLSPFDPAVLRIELPVGVAVAIPGAAPLRVTARNWVIRLPRDSSAPATVDATDLRAAMAIDAQESLVTASVVHTSFRPLEGGDIDAVASAQSVTLPVLPGAHLPLGSRVASLATEFLIHRPLPAPLLSGAAMAAWRAAGGAILVRRFALGYGPLGISGQGEFRLDDSLQPVGRATLRVVGFAETLDALAAGHVITPFVATAAGAELALLAGTPPGGGAPQVDTGLIVREGVASVAGFPLLRLPPIAWAPPLAPSPPQ